MGISIDGGIKYGWFIRENPTKMDDLGGTPISGNLHIVGSLTSRLPFGYKHAKNVWNWKYMRKMLYMSTEDMKIENLIHMSHCA